MEPTIALWLIYSILEAISNMEEAYNATNQNEAHPHESNIMPLCVDATTLLKHSKVSR